MIKNEKGIPVQWRKYSQGVHWNAATAGRYEKITRTYTRARSAFFDLLGLFIDLAVSKITQLFLSIEV
ncbi:hypothetical protein KCP70_10560 [Salmonella enterica subsp. enterica]|nr:hypothetical protein KCP70_10560 [Salmonella enterica subsp. enterica]